VRVPRRQRAILDNAAATVARQCRAFARRCAETGQRCRERLLTKADPLWRFTTHSRTVPSFEGVAGATIMPGSPPTNLPRYTAAKTLQTKTYEYFGEVMTEPLPSRSIRAVMVSDARLLGDAGAVVAKDGSLVLETLWDEEHYERDFARLRRARKPRAVEGTHASLISLWHNNYYHWLFDALPRLSVLEAAGLGNAQLIVPDPLIPWQQEMLDRIGVARHRLTPYSRGHLKPERLVWASAPAYIGFPTPFVVSWLRERLGNLEPSVAERRLYLKRSTNRRLANEADVMRILAGFGFEAVEPDRMSVAEQILVFSSARAVVAAHGAGVANTVFSDRLALLELFQPGFFRTPYFILAGAAGWDYWYLVCEPARRSGEAKTKSSDLRVPLDLLEATVDTMLAEC